MELERTQAKLSNRHSVFIVYFAVPFHTSLGVKLFIADVTGERFFARVKSNMLDHISPFGEASAAKVAAVWRHARVLGHVQAQLSLAYEGVVTVGAFIGFFAWVQPFMVDIAIARCKAFSTFITGVRFLPCVNTHVVLKTFGICKHFAADCAHFGFIWSWVIRKVVNIWNYERDYLVIQLFT